MRKREQEEEEREKCFVTQICGGDIVAITKTYIELSVGSNADGIEVCSVGNSQTLKETALIEAFNLKAAIEYALENREECVFV